MLLINKSELNRVLTILSRVAPLRSSTLPVLKCARLQTLDRQTVSLTVTNLDEYFTCRMRVSDAPEGLDALLPIPEVRNFIKGNKRALLQIEPFAPCGVSITEFADSQPSKQEFPLPETEVFPVMPPCPEKLFSAPGDFITALSTVAKVTSKRDPRAALHGILLDRNGIVGTDGKHLLCVPYDLPVKDSCVLRIPDCLFTAEFLTAASRFGIAQNGPTAWTTIEVAEWTLTAKCISGVFPNWQHIVPNAESLSFSMTLDKSQAGQFADALTQMTDTPPLHMLQLKNDEDKLEAFADCKPEQKAECTLSEVKGQLPEDGIMVNRELLLKALSMEHHSFACNPATFSPIVATGGLGKLVFMPIRMKDDAATAPNNETQTNEPVPHEPQTNKMENETMNNTNVPAPAIEKTGTTEHKAPVTPAAPNNGFRMVAPPDPYEELLEAVEELRTSIRTINEQASNIGRKVRDSQANFKKREKDMKAAREAIEKLKVSGF